MIRSFILTVLLGLALSAIDCNAQSIRSMIRNKIIEDQLESQAKKDSLEAVEEGREPEKHPNKTMDQVYMDALGLKGDVEYESRYDFDAYMHMEMETYKKNGKLDEKSSYDSYIRKDQPDYAMEFHDGSDRSTIIFDSENHAMLILTDSDGDKSGIAMEIDPEALSEQAEADMEESETEPYTLKKTGRKKEILGYTCEEYLAEEEQGEAHMWVSEKLGNQVRRNMLNNRQAFGSTFFLATHAKGTILEYEYLDKEDGERSVMKVTDLDLNRSHSISTDRYAIMSMKGYQEEE